MDAHASAQVARAVRFAAAATIIDNAKRANLPATGFTSPVARMIARKYPQPQPNPMGTNQDIEHLRLLSIFHYVLGAILAFIFLFPLIHVAFGIAMVTGSFDAGEGPPPPPAFGWLFIIFPLFIILCGWAMAFSLVLAGRRLTQHTSYMFCLVVAGIECLFTPPGTVLGVFTIVVLMRPSVRKLFGLDDSS